MKTILYIVKKEFLQLKRDPKMFGMILIAPILQLVVLGFAVTFDVNVVHTAVFDQDHSVESRKYVEDLESAGYFSIDYHVDSYDELVDLIDKGNIILGIVIPTDFEKDVNRNITTSIQAIFDGSDGNSALISAGYVGGVTSSFSHQVIVESAERSGHKFSISTISPETRIWYNPDAKTQVFMVPGIVGLLLMLITVILTSLAIVKEKEIGTLEQLIVTPIKPGQLILGKIIPFAILGFVAESIIILAMHVIFNISVRGNIFFLFFATFIYILSTLGLGMFISTISKTQQQAFMLAAFVVMLPMIYLSGFTFPIENMPAFIQYITYLIPLRYFMVIIRGIILKGVGFSELWMELLAMFAIGVGILYLSSLRFKKRLS